MNFRPKGPEIAETTLCSALTPSRSSAPPYTSLMLHFLQPQSALPHTTIVIVLDHGPTFLDGLHTWLTGVKCWVLGNSAGELEVTHDEHGKRSKSHLIFILVTSVLAIPT